MPSLKTPEHDLYIIAAGKGSRMGGILPKALIPLVGKTNIQHTLETVGHLFRKVFIVSNTNALEVWNDFLLPFGAEHPELCRNVQHLSIVSGRGDGHAVLQALRMTRFEQSRASNIIVMWGDAFLKSSALIEQLIDLKLEEHAEMGVVPVVRTEKPYVSLEIDGRNFIKHARFTRLDEHTEQGWHDQSVFKFDHESVCTLLEQLDAATDRDNVYMLPNHELSLLYVFHMAYNLRKRYVRCIRACEETVGFNTVEDVFYIEHEVLRDRK